MLSKMLNNVNVDSLVFYDKNYLNHDKNVEHIKNSLKEFGYIKTSIVVDENNVLLCGHGTLRAVKELGWNTVPEIKQITGLSEGRKKAYRISDNESGRNSEIIPLNLESELRDIGIELPNINMTDFGLNIGSAEEDNSYNASDREVNKISDFNVYQVVIECKDEQEQESIFNNLKNQGYKCKVLAL